MPVQEVPEKIDVNPPIGTRDFPPEEMRLRNWLFQYFKEVSQLFGFEEVDYPVLESEALFIGKAGEEIRYQLREANIIFLETEFGQLHSKSLLQLPETDNLEYRLVA
ncbi:hypothetical protein Ancab_031849 [Ancistrocladus abbreviatus]